MEHYQNLGGDSGVVAYELSTGSIIVQFQDSSVYVYTEQSAGPANIAAMQELAASGQGLNSFINTHVRKAYAQKLR